MEFLSCAPGSGSPTDIVTDAFVALVNDRGIPGLTARGLARQLGMNPGIVNQWFGSRASMLEQVVYRLGGRMTRSLDRQVRCHGVLGLLPPLPGVVHQTLWGQSIDEHTDAMTGLRAWLALLELGRSEPDLGGPLAEILGMERDLAGRLIPAEPDGVDLLLVVVHGVRCSLFGPEPTTLERARDLLTRHLELCGIDLPEGRPSAI